MIYALQLLLNNYSIDPYHRISVAKISIRESLIVSTVTELIGIAENNGNLPSRHETDIYSLLATLSEQHRSYSTTINNSIKALGETVNNAMETVSSTAATFTGAVTSLQAKVDKLLTVCSEVDDRVSKIQNDLNSLEQDTHHLVLDTQELRLDVKEMNLERRENRRLIVLEQGIEALEKALA